MQCPEVRLNIISSLESVNKGMKAECCACHVLYFMHGVILYKLIFCVVVFQLTYIYLSLCSDWHWSVVSEPSTGHSGTGGGHQVEGQASHHRVHAPTGGATGIAPNIYMMSYMCTSHTT